MTTKQIVLTIAAAVASFLIIALACRGAGANARGFILLPLAAAAGAGYYVARRFQGREEIPEKLRQFFERHGGGR